jgi:uncharacterized protein (DUF1015 family)
MVDIKPFKAIQYTEKANSLENLITQPYDKIDQQMQKEYYKKSPYNYCRLILPIEENRYTTVQRLIQEWLSKNILAKDKEPSVFVCRQTFKLNGETLTRTGLIAALRLYSYDENVVFPHEITYPAPKADRLNMLRTVQKDLEPVFLIYSDPEKVTINFFAELSQTRPIIEVEDSFKVTHAVWRVTDPAKIRLLQKALQRKALVITDGHHRYESAIAYRDERRRELAWTEDSAFNFHMSMLVPVQEEGVVVLPTHRLLKNCKLTVETLNALRQFFTVTEIEATVEGLDGFLGNHKDEHAFCIYASTKAYGLLLKHEKSVYEFVAARSSKETKLFDVVILRDVIFKTILKTGDLKMDEDILYVRWTRSAVEKVDSGEASIAFLVNPISAETVWQIAQQRERLPEKSTDFYPKLVSGLMMMDIASEEKL